MLGACDIVVLDPTGYIAHQQRDLIIVSTLLMLMIIVPVMVLTGVFAWRYRHSSKTAVYEPEWDHSIHLELAIWSVPLLIVVCLGALTWSSTHLLDPYRPIAHLDAAATRHVEAEPLRVNVIALDWKWLFIYPEYGIATVNELAAPINREIDFHITASSVMNSFYIPALAGQIYAMPAMETRLHAIMNEKGVYRGFSANYSGAGFSGMHFVFRSLTDADFDKWRMQIGSTGDALDLNAYRELERPSTNEPVHSYTQVAPGLFEAVVNMCSELGKGCMNAMAHSDGRERVDQAAPETSRVSAQEGIDVGRSSPDSSREPLSPVCVSNEVGQNPTRKLGIPKPANWSPIIGAGIPRPPLALFDATTSSIVPKRPRS
jgi:cytochrome o ubiquinol oxidase subunit 2